MCSTIGMPGAQQDRMGRPLGIDGGVDVQRVDAHQRDARGGQQLHGLEGQERVVVEVGVRAPEPVEAGVDEHGPARQLVRAERVGVDRGRAAPGDVDPDRGQVDQALERQPGEIRAVLPAMERAVHVGAGVAAQRDQVDLEGHARRVPTRAGGAVEDRVDLRDGQSRVGDHAGLDRVAEVDDSRCSHHRMLSAATADNRRMDDDDLRSWFDQQVEANAFRGVAIAWRDGAPIFEYAGGLAHRGLGVPVALDSRFAVASITKMATAVTALRLVDRGLARLDQPLVELLPAEHQPTALTPQHTLHHVLSHTSGLTNYHDDDDPRRGVVDVVLGPGRDLPRASAGGHPAAVQGPARACRARRRVPLRRRQLHPGGPRDRGADGSRLWRRRGRRGIPARGPRRHGDRGARRRPAAARRRLQGRRRTGRPMAVEHLQRDRVRHARRRDDHDRPRPGPADRRASSTGACCPPRWWRR